MSVRLVWLWCGGVRVRWCALALAALAALCLRCTVEHRASTHFLKVQPQSLAHLLADFSHQPNVGSWSVVEESSNYTTWRYAVRYECGPRCAGRAAVQAHDAPRAEPQHGAHALNHRVEVTLTTCRPPPLLPFPTFCDEMETVSVVSGGVAGGEGGAALVSAWRGRCAALAVLTGACRRALTEHHDALIGRVRAALTRNT